MREYNPALSGARVPGFSASPPTCNLARNVTAAAAAAVSISVQAVFGFGTCPPRPPNADGIMVAERLVEDSISLQHTQSMHSVRRVQDRDHRTKKRRRSLPALVAIQAPSTTQRTADTSSNRTTFQFRSVKFPKFGTKRVIDSATIARRAELQKVAHEALEIFRERYVDNQNINWDRMRERLDRRKITNERELYASIEWMMSQAGDQFTRFLPPTELDTMKDDIDGEMCGVGIVFDAETHGWRRTKRIIVKEIVSNSPASDAGISIGDEISAIDLASIRRMSVDEATNRLLGKEGQKVSISFIRCDDSVELSVTLTRRRFTVPTVSGESVVVAGVGRVAYLRVSEFAANTALQARRVIRSLYAEGRPFSVVVLDLRGNAGGLVDQAVELSRVFLSKEHTIVRFVGRNGEVTTENGGARWLRRARVRVLEEPLIVLVDETTASASELVAAALRDNCRAVIVGSSTYGKGSVQAIAQLSDGAGVAITVAQYRTPGDSPIEAGRGLKPDLYKPSLPSDASCVAKMFAKHPRRMRWINTRIRACCPP